MPDKSKIIDGYRYTKEHEWVKRDPNDSNIVIIGITDMAQSSLGDIVHVELPSVGDEFSIGDEIGVIESAKSASEIYAPISGNVTAVNCTLDTHPEHINESPYEEGWIVKIYISDPDELDNLLSPEGYEHYLEEEH